MSTQLSAPVVAAPRRAGRREWTALAVLAAPLLLVSMDVSILYFAVPQISRDLGASPTQQLWILDVYGFVLAGLLVTMGAVADRIGARRLLLVGAVAFSATSVVAAYADSAAQLIAARALLGVAGASLMPSTLSLIRTLFQDERQRSRAVAIWTGVMTGGIALGPVLSGVLLEHFWWGSVFLVNLPVMAVLIVCGRPLLPRTAVRRDVRFDPVSALLSLAAVLPVAYGLKRWAADGFDVAWPTLIAVGLVLGVAFVRRQLTHPHAMIAPALLRNRAYLGAVGIDAVATFAIVGNAVFMTAYLQLVLGYRPLAAALWSLAPAVAVGAVAPLAAGLAVRFGRRRVAASGLGIGALGFVTLTRAGTDSLALVLVGAGVLAGGLVLAMTVAADAILAALPSDQAGAGAAVSEAATELGGAFGIAVLGSIGAAAYGGFAGAHLPAALSGSPASSSLAGAMAAAIDLDDATADRLVEIARTAYVHGLHAAAVTGAVVLAVAALGTLVGGRRGTH